LGALQLLAFLSRRFDRWTLYWALSNLTLGLGVTGVTLRDLVPDIVSVEVSNTFTIIGYVLMVAGVRSFAGKPTHWRRYGLLGLVVVLLLATVWSEPHLHAPRIALTSAFFMLMDIAIAWEGARLARRENLHSAWLLTGIFVFTATIFATRTWMALAGFFATPSLFSTTVPAYQWMAAAASAFITIRGIALLLVAAERGQNSILATVGQDTLTGILNRSGLHLRFGELAGSHHGEAGTALTALMIDLDHFKQVNDTHGHHTGDEVLRHFAATARRGLRKNDILARLGGDEFVVLLPDASAEDAIALATRLRHAFDVGMPVLKVRPTLSIGMAHGNLRDDTLDALMRRADAALYRAKRAGRDQLAA
jgi:diguanylate cyclase (GGDEF)-like protein